MHLRTSFDSVIASCSSREQMGGWLSEAYVTFGIWDQPSSHTPGSTDQLITHPSCVNILGATDAAFLVIPYHKLGVPKPFSSGLFGRRKRQVLVPAKRPLGPAQERLAERHVRLDFPLLAGERVILDAQEGVEQEGWKRELVYVCELVPRGREVEECNTWRRASYWTEEWGEMSNAKDCGGAVTWEDLPEKKCGD